MENISKLGLKSNRLTPNYVAYCNDGWFTFTVQQAELVVSKVFLFFFKG